MASGPGRCVDGSKATILINKAHLLFSSLLSAQADRALAAISDLNLVLARTGSVYGKQQHQQRQRCEVSLLISSRFCATRIRSRQQMEWLLAHW